MLDLLAPVLAPEQGERLTREAYHQDFWPRDAAAHDRDSWKLERRQDFQELNSPSWEAVCRGEWEESLRLFEDRRDTLIASAQEDNRKGHRFHRVRVVEKPLTPYVQWELHSHRQRAELGGELIRVATAQQVAASEGTDLVPEVVVLGGCVLYQVIYTEAGVADGAIRYDDPALVERWDQYLRALYVVGEDMIPYFKREVAHLPPPKFEAKAERRKEEE